MSIQDFLLLKLPAAYPIETNKSGPWKYQEWPKEGAFGVFALTATEPMGEKPLCPAKVERWHQ